jgi:hypothetical protein
MAGAVRNAGVTLRPVRSDGSVDWNDSNILGSTLTFSNGIYQATLYDEDYRGAILVEVRARTGFAAEGGNPATAISNRFHPMEADHFLYAVVPVYAGYNSVDNHVTPLTTVAVTRGMSFNGSIAGVPGGVGAGMYGLMSVQVGEFFGLQSVRASLPEDFAKSGGFGDDDMQSFVLAGLSQLAKDIGVNNVWDFWLGMAHDAADDGELNGSIGFVPNTGVTMPDLGQAGVLDVALRDNYLDPNNSERVIGLDNTEIDPDSRLQDVLDVLAVARGINLSTTRQYELTLRVPGTVTLPAGGTAQTHVISVDRIGGTIDFHPYGDSAGPSFVEYNWVSSAPGVVDVQDFGLITVAPGTPDGNFTLTLTVRPAIGQAFVTGPTEVHSVTVKVR